MLRIRKSTNLSCWKILISFVNNMLPMKFVTLSFLFFLLQFQLFATDFLDRLDVDARLAPFYHGVASDEPRQNSAIIWTRVTTDEDSVVTKWRFALDTAFTQMIDSGEFTTNPSLDYTVKIDVGGLNSNTYYFYEFEALGKRSIIGRTKTAPKEDEVEQLRFAFVSCASYQHGYFNAYGRLAERNDIDAVLHLGDYIYEYAPGEYGSIRAHFPEKEMVTLAEYQSRHSQYKLDPNLRNVHQMYPMIATWDDHESTDNSWRDGASNHQPETEGEWSVRKRASMQAYYQWMPLRLPDMDDDKRIFRSFSYGNIADIFVLDTRLYDRDEQGEIFGNNSSKKLLGPYQMDWLKNELSSSEAKWKIVAQQVMVGPLTAFGLALNMDQWDGYPADRKELMDHIKNNNIDNVVVLTGDIHTSWAMDLPFGDQVYLPSTGRGSIAVEFVTTSITSPGAPSVLGGANFLVKDVNPHIKYVDLIRRGFGVLDLTLDKAQNDFYYVPTIERPNNSDLNYRRSYYTLDGENRLKVDSIATTSIYPLPIIPPALPRSMEEEDTSVTSVLTSVIITGAYPNPFSDIFSIQFYSLENISLVMELYDIQGRKLLSKDLGLRVKGALYNEHFDGSKLPNGLYFLRLSNGKKQLTWKIQKSL